jgi:hypothetical protein
MIDIRFTVQYNQFTTPPSSSSHSPMSPTSLTILLQHYLTSRLCMYRHTPSYSLSSCYYPYQLSLLQPKLRNLSACLYVRQCFRKLIMITPPVLFPQEFHTTRFLTCIENVTIPDEYGNMFLLFCYDVLRVRENDILLAKIRCNALAQSMPLTI